TAMAGFWERAGSDGSSRRGRATGGGDSWRGGSAGAGGAVSVGMAGVGPVPPADGTTNTAWHRGQRTCLPAALSGTLNCFLQALHVTRMGMADLSRFQDGSRQSKKPWWARNWAGGRGKAADKVPADKVPATDEPHTSKRRTAGD